MFIIAFLVGITQGVITYIQFMRKEIVIDVAKNPKIMGIFINSVIFIVALLSIGTLIWFTFYSTSEDINIYLNLKYVTIGALWTLMIEASCIAACTSYALKHNTESKESNKEE